MRLQSAACLDISTISNERMVLLSTERCFIYIKFDDLYAAIRDDDEIHGSCFRKVLDHMKSLKKISIPISEVQRFVENYGENDA